MPSLGFAEIAFCLVIALIVFGPRRLPEIGRSFGKSLSEFKRASNELRQTVMAEIDSDNTESTAAAPAAKEGVDAPATDGGAAGSGEA